MRRSHPSQTFLARDWDEMGVGKEYDLMAANARAASPPEMMESKSFINLVDCPVVCVFSIKDLARQRGNYSILSSCVPGADNSIEYPASQ